MEILLVDDNELLLHRLGKEIQQLGNDILVHLAVNSKQARQVFARRNPDLIVLDISLPDCSGIDLLRSFKTARPHTQVIMFSQYGTEEFKSCCFALGADDFFEKERMSELINTIQDQHKIK